MTSFNDFIFKKHSSQCFIAHCLPSQKRKLKNEVVPINETYKFNQKNKKNYLSPRKWDQFLKVKGAKIIDARKPFEYEIGTFKGSINPNTKNFRDFKNYLMGLKKNEPIGMFCTCLLYTSPSPRDRTRSRMPSSA